MLRPRRWRTVAAGVNTTRQTPARPRPHAELAVLSVQKDLLVEALHGLQGLGGGERAGAGAPARLVLVRGDGLGFRRRLGPPLPQSADQPPLLPFREKPE